MEIAVIFAFCHRREFAFMSKLRFNSIDSSVRRLLQNGHRILCFGDMSPFFQILRRAFSVYEGRDLVLSYISTSCLVYSSNLSQVHFAS